MSLLVCRNLHLSPQIDFGTLRFEFEHNKHKLRYRVSLEKVLHKREEKMQEKIKLSKKKDKNWVQVQQ